MAHLFPFLALLLVVPGLPQLHVHLLNLFVDLVPLLVVLLGVSNNILQILLGLDQFRSGLGQAARANSCDIVRIFNGAGGRRASHKIENNVSL